MPDPIPNSQTQTIGLVKSGSGSPVVPLSAVPSTQYTNDPALLRSIVYSTQNTRPTQISRAQLDAADKNYTTAINTLSSFWSSGNTNSNEYTAAKTAALAAEKKWQLARDGLEEISGLVKSRSANSGTGLNDEWFAKVIGTSGKETPNLGGDNNNPVPTGGDVPAQDGPGAIVDEVSVVSTKVDHRVRIRAKPANEDELYGTNDSTGVTSPLRATRGVVFPYTPTITMSHTANYSQMTPIHANTDYFLYSNTPAVQIQISGQFSAQNEAEAQYMIAAMHFFRTVTKMHFGETDENRGLPPPIVILSGHGDFMLNDLSGIVTSFSMDLPPNVDYLEIIVDGHQAFVPALTTFNVNFVVQQTPKKQREFNFDEFANGSLMNIAGWI